MAMHLSSAERLDDLDEFYGRLLELVGPVASLADLACAYNPLTLPWLRDRTDAGYVGYDFNATFVDLGRRFAAHVDPTARLVHADVLTAPKCVGEDVALLLKTFHCIEARRRGAGLRLVEELDVRTVVVSLPTRTRSGRSYGFAAGHGRTIEVRAGELGWTIATARLLSEELWAIEKRPVT
jgi:16S rRNA (guanine(1405)-N(7))-methyltransferase